MRDRLFVVLFLAVFHWIPYLQAAPSEGLKCDLQTVTSKAKVSALKIEVLRDPRSSSLTLQFPASDGFIRRLPARLSEMPIEELHNSLDQVLREMQGPQCFSRPQCRAFAWKVRQIHGPILQKIRTVGATVVVYAATKGDPTAPTLFEVKDEAGAVIGVVGFVGWGQVGTCR